MVSGLMCHAGNSITQPSHHEGAAPRRVSLSLPYGSSPSEGAIETAAALAQQVDCYLDLRGFRLDGLDLGGERDAERKTWNRLIFGMNDRRPAASVDRCNFERAVLTDCLFAGMELIGLDFTECELTDCDFRFATFRGVRLGSARIVRCDLYGASMESATIMSNIHFELSSLPQFGDGITGLDWSAVANPDGSPAIVGEKADLYLEFLKRTKDERPPNGRSILDAVDDRLPGAAAGYRRLSGYWAAQGQFWDANSAYTHSRRLEREASSPWFAISRRIHHEGRFSEPRAQRHAHRAEWSLRQRFQSRGMRPVAWIGLWVADLTCRFGQSLTRVFVTLLTVALVPGIAYALFGGVTGAKDVFDDLLFSISRLTAVTPAKLASATQLVEWVGAVQSLVGIALVGLFGYVLGNVLRQA